MTHKLIMNDMYFNICSVDLDLDQKMFEKDRKNI
jgi:hypothetical protein